MSGKTVKVAKVKATMTRKPAAPLAPGVTGRCAEFFIEAASGPLNCDRCGN